MKKRALSFFLAVLLLLMLVPISASAETYSVERVINVVYDDSSSMIIDDATHNQVDRWCQAKYAMEVFAALLGTGDTLNIYCMSDFSAGGSQSVHLSLKGSDGAKKNVDSIHSMLTSARMTPFGAVEKAYSDLLGSGADEKWLVILTDGEFQSAPSLNTYFANKDPNVKVMFLGLSETTDNIIQNPENNVFFAQAKDSKEILQILTDASTRIFNINKLTVAKNGEFSFDLPMSELVVFAQGKNVKIKGIRDTSGDLIAGEKEQVSVQYCEKPSNDSYTSPKNVIATNLVGTIVTFSGDYDVGSYTLDVSGADTAEIYYKPNIDIGLILYDKDGIEVTSLEKLEAGEYTVRFGFVKKGTNEQVPQSALLGDVKYDATISNNGTELGKFSSGEKVDLKEGNISMNAMATYLEYNVVSTSASYRVWSNKVITYSFDKSNPTYYVTKKGVSLKEPLMLQEEAKLLDIVKAVFQKKGGDENDPGSVVTAPGETVKTPYKVSIRLNGEKVTPEQWRLFTVPTIRLGKSLADVERAETFFGKLRELFSKKEDGFIFTDTVVEKGSEPGEFLVYPVVMKDEPKRDGTEYSDIKFVIDYSEQVDEELWSGRTESKLKVKDGRTWAEKHEGPIKVVLWFLGFLLLLLIYLLKKRFPKSMKRKPKVIVSYLEGQKVVKKSVDAGLFTISLASKLIPLVPLKGTVKIPRAAEITLHVTAKGRRKDSIWLTNASAFAGNKKVAFDGQPIEEGTKGRLSIASSTEVKYTTPFKKYECTLNE